jgi:hypothetical protein
VNCRSRPSYRKEEEEQIKVLIWKNEVAGRREKGCFTKGYWLNRRVVVCVKRADSLLLKTEKGKTRCRYLQRKYKPKSKSKRLKLLI